MTKRKTPDDIAAKLASLAVIIADEAMGGSVPLDARLDAFAKLTTYYVNTTKINSRPDEGEDEGEGFGNFQQRIAAASKP